jgi:uncharacterized protein
MRRFFLGFLTLWALSGPVLAECSGKNLIAAMPEAEQSALRAQADAQPFAVGNFWLASKGSEVIHLIGTYHFNDPRHAATMARLAPILADAHTLLVEAGPAEEESLKQRITDDPSLIINTKGPTLPEIMQPEDWKRLSTAVSNRGVPAIMAAKFRPWYVSMLLSIPVCSMADQATPNGLDNQLIQAAHNHAIPVKALEPYDTVFDIFGKMTQQQQVDMLTAALGMEEASADVAATLGDSYFAEEGRLIWEFNRQQTLLMPGYTQERVDAEFAVLEKTMMTDRNRNWIPVIEAAAKDGPVLVAFGALHLSGETGVLNLLQKDGYNITRQPFQ